MQKDHMMHTPLLSTAQSRYARAVLEIVILSIRLSYACFVTKLKNILPNILIEHEKEITLAF